MALFSELQRVAHQIREDLLEAHRVADDARWDVRVDLADEFEAFLVCPHGQRLDRVGDGGP